MVAARGRWSRRAGDASARASARRCAVAGRAGGVSDESPPTARERAENFALRFRSNANHLAIAYGGPLYLVGSALTSLLPGDIDLRLLLDRTDCEAMWG